MYFSDGDADCCCVCVDDKYAGQAPALIREGGSYGGITRFLEEKLKAPAIHFPMGQVPIVYCGTRWQ
jgi:hypothetical protein